MRGVTDALRSVVRQTDVVLNAGPAPLGEVYWSLVPGGPEVYRWTHGRIAPGCLEVDERAWTWLELSRLGPPEAVVSAGRRWERRRMVFPPSAGDIAAHSLPTVGVPVAAPGSLEPLPTNLWEVRWAAERGEVLFPFCRVNLSAGVVATNSASFQVYTQPMVLECYPVEMAENADLALILATRTADVLTEGFCGAGVGVGRSKRIPLYDYEAVPLEEGVSQRRLPQDFLRIEDWSSRTLPDPSDARRVACIVDLRVAWDVSVARHRGTRLVDSVLTGIDGG